MGSDPSGYSTFCPALCLNRSASDRGLKVVVEVVALGGCVLMLNRLNFVVEVVGAVTGCSRSCSCCSFCCSWMCAHGSRLDCSRSSLELMSCSVVVVVVVVGGGGGGGGVVVAVVAGLLAVEDLTRVVVALLSLTGAVGMNGIGVCSL